MIGSRRGFSTAELMIVLVVLIVTLGLSRGLVRGFLWSSQLESTSSVLIQDIGATRIKAIARNRPYRLTPDAEAGTYKVQYQSEGQWRDDGSPRGLPSGLSFVSTGQPVFRPNGILESSTVIRLKNQKDEMTTVEVSLGGKVKLSWGTWKPGQGHYN